MTRSILILLLASTCIMHAGAPISLSDTSWPSAASSNPTNDLPAGMALWWNSEDLSSSPVETWTDRVQGFNMKQTSASLKPTWTTNGVSFDGSNDYLTLTNWISTRYSPETDGKGAWLFVWKIPDPSPTKFIIGETFSGGDFFLQYGSYGYGEGQGAPTLIYPITTNYTDLFIVCTNVGEIVAYTNGVKAYHSDIAWVYGSSSGPSRLGNPFSGGTAPLMTIKEIICWTNHVFTEAEVNQIHSYVTNAHPDVTAAIPYSDCDSGAGYTACTAVFDGTNDYMKFDGTGGYNWLVDGKQFTFSALVRFDGGDGADQVLFSSATTAPASTLIVRRNASNKIAAFGRNSSGTTILDIAGSTSVTSGSGWTHVFVCVDLADTAKRKIYVNGVAETLTVTTYTDAALDLHGTGYDYTVGASITAVSKFNGAMTELWWRNSYTDSPSSFALGTTPLDIGDDGSLATGSRPVFYLHYAGDTFSVNSGTGRSFIVTGSLGTTTPP